MKGVGKIAGQIIGTFGREATRQITRNLFGGRRRYARSSRTVIHSRSRVRQRGA